MVDVYLRIRPATAREQSDMRCVFAGDPRSVYVDDPGGLRTHRFEFEGVIDSSDGGAVASARGAGEGAAAAAGGQLRVFEAVGAPAVRKVSEGYHTCLFSLGQTGTGKTYTVIGTHENPGLLPRMLDRLLGGPDRPRRCRLSCLELHMDRIRDLLADDFASLSSSSTAPPPVSHAGGAFGAERPCPEIRSIPGRGVTVSNLSEVSVDNPQTALRLIHSASRNRYVSRTSMNASSSRGHGVYQLTMDNGARLCVVDLAGRENEKTTGCRGQSLAELAYINKSLFHLTNVIQALARPSARGLVPFRNSKLTLLLSDCLQSARTSLVATVGPTAANVDDTLATLRLAQTVRQIATKTRRATHASWQRLLPPPPRPCERREHAELASPMPALLPGLSEVGEEYLAASAPDPATVPMPFSVRRRSSAPAAPGVGAGVRVIFAEEAEVEAKAWDELGSAVAALAGTEHMRGRTFAEPASPLAAGFPGWDGRWSSTFSEVPRAAAGIPGMRAG